MIRTYVRYALLFVAGVAVMMWLNRRASGPGVGSEAIPFELPLVTGASRFDLAKERGKPVLIEAFASWCSACRGAAPTLSEAAQAERKRPVRFVGVSLDDSAAQAAQAKSAWQIPYDVALDDGSFSKAYRITLLPTFVLIDADGRVRRVKSGSPSDDELESWLAEVGAARR